MLGVFEIHRNMAKVIYMNLQPDGSVILGAPEFKLLIPLLLKNYELVRKFDELFYMAFAAQLGRDMDWQQDICRIIEDLEVRNLGPGIY